MLISELQDGQKIETMDDLYYIQLDGEDNTYNTDDCYVQLTGNLLRQMCKIASAGDIGTYNEEFGAIKFMQPNPNLDGVLVEEEYIFFEGPEGKLDLNMFALVDDE